MSVKFKLRRYTAFVLPWVALPVVTFGVWSSLALADTPATPKTDSATAPVQAASKERLLSFFFQNIDIRSLLQIIAKSSNLNFVISDNVKGNMTLSLKDVTWQQALDTVLSTHGLTSKRVGSVLYISTIEEMTANLAKTMQSEQALASLEPLTTRLIRLKYTDAESMANLLKGPQGELLSGRGQVSLDKRTNSLIVVDTKKSVDSVVKTVARLDIPAKQVLIEARIVSMDTTYEEQLGVRFGVSNSHHLSGTFIGANKIANGVSTADISNFNPTERLNFNLPAAALTNGSNPGSIGLALAKIGSIFLDLELSALENEGHINIISRPRVVTSNQQKAIIETGEEIPYQEATSSGATSISFKKAVLSLEVTPLITPDNKIVLKLKATQDTRGPQLTVIPQQTVAGVAIAAQFGPPTINTQSVESYILMKNNETFVVGGVYKNSKTNSVDRIPFFGKLPVVGNLFTHRGVKNEKTELLIFITPKIINSNKLHAAGVYKDAEALG